MSMAKREYLDLIKQRALSIVSLAQDGEATEQVASLVRSDHEAIGVYLNGLDMAIEGGQS